ncbi:MAG: valine--tRNA ligase [Nanoarchaeota archaeon]|nr:valine--tRNA ligase [Nanoarchaeota archaeon]
MSLDKYDAKIIESKWVKKWEEEGTYKFNPKSKKKFYSIDTPPPTVSGKMHLGHSSSYTQQDVIVRYMRMKGFEIFYPFGTDDNGLPTERLVEKLKGVKGSKMKRNEFTKLCYNTVKEIRPDFIKDWKNIGMSCDFSILYSTIDEHCRRISQRSFIELYNKGREYRMKSPTIWCPTCETAIAQVELEDKELDSEFVEVKFKLDDGKDLVIATTRPEMFPACVAIFANPNDKRYKHLFGKKARVPLFNHSVPIIADEHADPEKGTGVVMCCTFGDQTDIEWYKAHKLPLKIIITTDGLMNELAGKYKGMKIKDARKAVIKDLESENLLVNRKKITHNVNVHERCSTEVEILESNQWFIKYLDLKDKFLELGNKMKWYPDYMHVRYDNWIKGLRWDWCISRQRFYGVPFPVWYCKKCGELVLADINDLPVDPLVDKPKKKCKCGSSEFEPEKDILDTWATSALTPRLSVELAPKEIQDKLFPMNLRPNAHDIITFWLFNTVVKSWLHYETIPWKDIIISGHVQDPQGKKMSKSKGNTIAPQDVINKFSADALRYFVTNVSLGDDYPYKEQELVRGSKLAVKLWNAAKFIQSHELSGSSSSEELIDEFIVNELNNVISKATAYLDDYDYSKAKKEIVEFFWGEFADYYLEMVKYRLYGTNQASKNSVIKTLNHVFLNVLKMICIYMPFVTEEIYRNLYDSKESIHNQSWPIISKKFSTESGKDWSLLKNIISEGRQYKINNQLSLGTELSKAVIQAPKEAVKLKEVIKGTLRIKELEFKEGKELKLTIL